MATSKERASYIVEQLNIATDGQASSRAMMGEYVIYYRDKVAGGIYDSLFLVKPTQSAEALLPDAERRIPYEGAKEMLLVEEIDNHKLMAQLLQSMYPELPARKPRKKK